MRTEIPLSTIAKLFWNGKSQAVRLPKAFRFDGTEVVIRRVGKDVILSSKPKGRKTLSSDWAAMLASLPEIEDDFMRVRPLNNAPPSQDVF